MHNKLAQDVLEIARNSVIEQIKIANALFDIAGEVIKKHESAPEDQKMIILEIAELIFRKAEHVSESAKKAGKDLAETVGE